MTGEPRIFISYSRQDGAAAAAEIRDRLAAEGLSLWQDLVAMDGGRDWWRQIEEAITKAEYLVLLLTPKALESEVCAKEWRYARQQGTYVIPVSDGPPGALELHRLARWMRRVDIVDRTVPERWTWLVAKLKQPPQIRRVPMMAEAPPSDFVPRPAEFAKLKAALLDPASKDAVGITAALKGAGGYGKTTLARALCADPDIQDAYHDGVLWVTLGESPGDLLGRVEDLIAIVSGERPGFANVEAACVRLEELLAERRMLIVIDDAWNAADTRPFLRGGPHCARLLTTRDSGTLPRGAAEQPVDQMRGAEAVALLRAGLPPGEDEAFRHAGGAPGRMAAAAAPRQRRPGRPGHPHARLAAGRAGPCRQAARQARPHRLRRERPEGTARRSRQDAGPEPRSAGCERAGSAWPNWLCSPRTSRCRSGPSSCCGERPRGLDEIDTEELLQRLYGLSLLLQLDLDRRFLQLHDVIRAWLRDRLGSGLAEVERFLVDGYRSDCGGEWHRLDDAYALAHLPIHLRSVDEAAWRRLLLDPRWMARKLADGPGVAALIDDYRDTADDLRLVGDALRLSAHVIGRDPTQLPAQLCGRLGNSEAQGTRADRLRAGHPPGPSLSRHAPHAPGGPLISPSRTCGRSTPWRSAGRPPRPLRLSDKTSSSGSWRAGPSCAPSKAMPARSPPWRSCPTAAAPSPPSGDDTLKLWDLESGAVLRTFEGHVGLVTAVVPLPDGRRALSGSEDKTLKLWDLETGAVLRTLEGHIGWGDRRGAATRRPPRALRLRGQDPQAMGSGKRRGLAHPRRPHRWVTAVALLPDGSRALSGSWDHTLKLWDLESGASPAHPRSIRRCGQCSGAAAGRPPRPHGL